MFDHWQYRLLKRFAPNEQRPEGSSAAGAALELLLGRDFVARMPGKTVLDFGCGEGALAVEMASRGAGRVIGIDIREEVLETARRRAAAAGVASRCQFVTSAAERADIVVSVDAFEHFGDPAGVLDQMHELLVPDGEILISFGPTWYHPLGGHLFSVFPWAHLLFSEKALLRWRAEFRSDGATRFSEVAGGLNQMTIGRFERLIRSSRFTVASFDLAPIRRLRAFHNRWTREFTTSLVRCRLTAAGPGPDGRRSPPGRPR